MREQHKNKNGIRGTYSDLIHGSNENINYYEWKKWSSPRELCKYWGLLFAAMLPLLPIETK